MTGTRVVLAACAIVAGALAAGCLLPTGLGGPEGTPVGAIVREGGAARLIELAAGGDGVAVPLVANRSAMLMFNSQRSSPDRLAVTIRPTAYRTASLGEPAAFEPRLRALESRMPRPATAKHYRVAQAARYERGSRENFWVIAAVANGQADESQVSAEAAYVGSHCYVFVDRELGKAYQERAELIGRAFDDQIFPTNAKLFGEPLASGVNGDPRVSLLVSPAVGNYGKDTVIGYFTVRDLFPPGADPGNPLLARSNQRLMLYVSSVVVGRGQASDFLGTIAHEYQHLINASQKLFSGHAKPRTEDVWLDEGLSMYAMEANGYGLGGAGGVVYDHVAGYMRHPGQYSLTHWSLNPDQSAYGAAYLFTTYLVERFGEGMLRELVRSPEVGAANIEARLQAKQTGLDAVFHDWTIANLLDDTGLSNDPRHGYRTINLLGSYGGKRLHGLSLEPVKVPNTGALSFKPYSAQYYFVPKGPGGTFSFQLMGGGGQNFGGLLIAP